MKQIFLILSNQSDYESHPIVVGFVSTQDEAFLVTETLKAQYRFAREFMDINITKAKAQFRIDNPDTYLTTLYSNLKLEDIPKWPSGISEKLITPEMRQERTDIKKRNEIRLQDASMVASKYRMAELEYLQSEIDKVKDTDWFKKWFDVGPEYIHCKANGLVESYEYIYESCNEITLI